MELFNHFPQYMKNLTRVWDMVGHLQDGKKKLLVTKETFQDTVRQPDEVSLINFLFSWIKLKNPCMEE